MPNRRVHEVAKELELDRQELVTKINELDLGFSVNNYMSRLSPTEVDRLKDALEDEQEVGDESISADEMQGIGPAVIRRRGQEDDQEPEKQQQEQKQDKKEEQTAEAEAQPSDDETQNQEAAETEAADEEAETLEAQTKEAEQQQPSETEAAADVAESTEAERADEESDKQVDAEQQDQKEAADTTKDEPEPKEAAEADQQEQSTEKQASKQKQDDHEDEEDSARVLGQIDQNVVLDRLSAEGKKFKDKKDKNKKKGKSSKRVVESGELYSNRNRPKKRRKKKKSSKPQKTQITQAAEHKRVIEIEDVISVGDLAHEMGEKAGEIAMKLLENGMQATVNTMLDYETASLIADEYGYKIENVAFDITNHIDTSEPDEDAAQKRPPVVTVMGHVDHGKTSLLDAIRKSDVTGEEEGGITQHIGAYTVNTGDDEVTFIDTPGHKAFTQLRARGAKVTDIVILVIAADDGVMPQTVEAINHAKDADVPIIVAMNKMDLPQANPDRAKQALTEYELIPEEWGGTTLFVEVSAKEHDNIDELLESVVLQAELEDLKANPDRDAQGVIIESELDVGRGPVTTVLVQRGTLHQGDVIVSGQYHGRVRTMHDYRGEQIDSAGPSHPVELTGLDGVPSAGEPFFAVESKDEAKRITEHVEEQRRKEQMANKAKEAAGSLEDLSKMIQQGEIKELKVIVKGDVQGSVEALTEAFDQIGNEEVQANVIHSGVGGITENDVNLAASAEEAAVIVGFNVRSDSRASELAEEYGVKILTHNVIYDAIDQVRRILEGLLEPEIEERILGRAEVRQIFSTPRAGNVAGCYVEDGVIRRNAKARVIRDDRIVTETDISSLRRFQDDVKEVQTNYECGVSLKGFNAVEIGDIIEAFDHVEVEATL